MKSNRKNRLLLAAVTLTLTAPSAFAAALTWDTTSADGATISAASGNWNTTAGNSVWNNGTSNVIWSQTSTTDGSNTATFAGADGTTDQYVITLAAQMAAESITFSNTGYKITGSTLALIVSPAVTGPPAVAAVNGAITVASGKTATINSILLYAHNVPASVVVGASSVLNLGGGTTAGSFNPQFAFTGAGTVNMTAGTYNSNVGTIGNATFNQTGGTFNITPGNAVGYNLNSATQNVAYNLSAGTLSVNGNNTTATVNNAFLGIGNGTATNTAALNVSGTGIMNVGTTATTSGEIRIGNSTASNGTLNVSGGVVTVGTGSTANQIYFFKAGSNSSFTTTMNQSAGTVTTNGIQFGGSTGTYAASSSATLKLSGGSLYVGAQGITLGSAASTLPTTIQLQGGTLGADQDWSSSMSMKLGTTAGGPTIRAQNSASTARNIALSGILSDDGAVNGILTKTGTGTLTLSNANSYTGLTTVTAGSLSITSTGSLASGNALTLGADGTADLANASQNLGAVNNSNTATNALNFSNAGGTVVLASLTGAGKTRFGSNGTVTGGISEGTVTAVGTLNANISGGTVGAGSLSSTSITGGTTTVGGVATIGTLTSGTANLNGSTSSIAILNGGTVNLDSTTLSVGAGTTSGSITGASGALTVTGALALNGTTSYGGVTTVSAGADLRINGTHSGTGAINIAATGKLGGSGSVKGGINVSGILAPGNSIESLGGGDLNFATGSVYGYELQTDLFDDMPNLAGDLTYSSGTLNIASGTILTLKDLGTSKSLAGGSKLTLISSAGAWNAGLFSYDAGAGLVTLEDDSDITLGANIWRLSYNDTIAGGNFVSDTAGATNYVTLTVVPEPNVATLVGGLGMLALLRRRRN